MKKNLNRTYSNTLNLANFIPETQFLGPGIRSAIWVQGCPFNCRGCIAPEWIPIKENHKVIVEDIARQILESKKISGITISGGEPMLQAGPLRYLLEILKQERDLDVICFTGFKYEDLMNRPSYEEQRKLLCLIDLLIDGPYNYQLNDDHGFRGSSNQRIIHLTSRFDDVDFNKMTRKIEIRISNGSIMLVGIPNSKALVAYNNTISNL